MSSQFRLSLRRVSYMLLKITFLISVRRSLAFTVPPICCSSNSMGPPERHIVNWETCGHSIEYILEDGTRFCVESSDMRQDIQNLTKHLPRKTVTDKIHLFCRESLAHVNVRGEIQCVEDTCSNG